jgi:histidine triad (HIT) family protein
MSPVVLLPGASVDPVPPDCLFCKIVAGEVPSEQVAATAGTYAFRDIEPAAPVHVLVVPRRHIDDAGTLGTDSSDADVLGELFATARAVARSEGVEASGYRLVFNVGDDAANSVGHLHLHVLGGRRLGWPPG